MPGLYLPGWLVVFRYGAEMGRGGVDGRLRRRTWERREKGEKERKGGVCVWLGLYISVLDTRPPVHNRLLLLTYLTRSKYVCNVRVMGDS